MTNFLKVRRVQKKYLFIYWYRYLCNDASTSRSTILTQLNMRSLTSRTRTSNILLLHKILNGTVHSSQLLSYISFRVPRLSTRVTYFYIRKLNRHDWLELLDFTTNFLTDFTSWTPLRPNLTLLFGASRLLSACIFIMPLFPDERCFQNNRPQPFSMTKT